MYILTENQFNRLFRLKANLMYGSNNNSYKYDNEFKSLLSKIEKQKIEIKKEELM